MPPDPTRPAAAELPRRRAFWDAVHARHPRVTTAVVADARITARRRGERSEYRSRLDAAVQVARLALVTESFLGQCCYRAKAGAQAKRIPLLPRLLNHLAVRHGHIAVGDPVIMAPGVFIPHGQVVIDGITEIGSGTTIGPFVTIGLRAGDHRGPHIGEHVSIGTGAKVIGPWKVGARAQIGANAVVTSDIEPGRVAAGVPARVVG